MEQNYVKQEWVADWGGGGGGGGIIISYRLSKSA